MNDCNKYSTCRKSHSHEKHNIFRHITPAWLHGLAHNCKNSFLSLKEHIKHGREKKTERERPCVRWRRISSSFPNKPWQIFVYGVIFFFFLKFDTSSQLIILKGAVKIEMSDLQSVSIWQQSQHMTSQQLCWTAAVSMVCKIEMDKQLLLPLLTQRAQCCLSAPCFPLSHGKYCKGKMNRVRAERPFVHPHLLPWCREPDCGRRVLEIQKLLHQTQLSCTGSVTSPLSRECRGRGLLLFGEV